MDCFSFPLAKTVASSLCGVVLSLFPMKEPVGKYQGYGLLIDGSQKINRVVPTQDHDFFLKYKRMGQGIWPEQPVL
jgi:hypothetical protein